MAVAVCHLLSGQAGRVVFLNDCISRDACLFPQPYFLNGSKSTSGTKCQMFIYCDSHLPPSLVDLSILVTGRRGPFSLELLLNQRLPSPLKWEKDPHNSEKPGSRLRTKFYKITLFSQLLLWEATLLG
jgi:hypothetical protein